MKKETITVTVSRVRGTEDIPLPAYMTVHSAGMDVYAAVEKETVILPGERKLIPTGISIALPEGYEASIRPRSGLALHYGVTILNAPGTIDADYRGEIGVIIINHGENPFVVKRGDRIAQMVITGFSKVSWSVCDALNATQRGSGGFGHTG
ncbi:MAG TPA: dUTP diphosphatase [Deltaproteobacteria bacterium]|nr:dUTP diphosphatase [Deltaproteobacteria bacterium]